MPTCAYLWLGLDRGRNHMQRGNIRSWWNTNWPGGQKWHVLKANNSYENWHINPREISFGSCILLNQSGPWLFVWSPLLDINCKILIFVVAHFLLLYTRLLSFLFFFWQNLSFKDSKPAVRFCNFLSMKHFLLLITFSLRWSKELWLARYRHNN